MKAKVLVVGYLSIDEIGTPQGRFAPVPGGAALYAALGVRHAGAQASICACVGDDYPRDWLHAMSELGVDLSHVSSRPGPSRRALISHALDGQRSSANHAQDSWWQRTRALVPLLPDALDDITAVVACPMPVAQLGALLDAAQRHKLAVIADTSEAFASEETDSLLALLPCLRVFTPSREETRLLLPGLEDEEAAIKLASLGIDVLQKRGADGAFAVVAGASSGMLIPAQRGIRVTDPTGAGDSTIGALAAYLAQGRGFLQAVAPALLTGSHCVTGIGPSTLGFPLAAARSAQAVS